MHNKLETNHINLEFDSKLKIFISELGKKRSSLFVINFFCFRMNRQRELVLTITMWSFINLISIAAAQLTDTGGFIRNTAGGTNNIRAPSFRPEAFRHSGYAVITQDGRSLKEGGDQTWIKSRGVETTKKSVEIRKNLKNVQNGGMPGRAGSGRVLYDKERPEIDEGWSGREGGFQLDPENWNQVGGFQLEPENWNQDGGFLRGIQQGREEQGSWTVSQDGEKREKDLVCFPQPRVSPGSKEFNLTCTCAR